MNKSPKKTLNRNAKISPVAQGLIKKTSIQTKLKVGKANDKYEVEADRMADRVVNNAPAIQRKCAACGQEDKLQKKPVIQKQEDEELQAKLFGGVQRKEIKNQPDFIQKMQTDEEQVQAKQEGGGESTASSWVSQKVSESKGGGQPLSQSTRSFMETGFGRNFSNVRVHTDSTAVQMNKQLGAQAFTHGNNVYFNEGKYNPESQSGKHLLAHELTHTMQQGGAVQKMIQRKPKSSAKQIHDYFEKKGSCACLVHMHNDERNSKAVARLLNQKCNYALIDVRNDVSEEPKEGNPRLLKEKMKGPGIKQRLDPNGIFSPAIIKTCHTTSPKNQKICNLYNHLHDCSEGFSKPVIALHNDTLFEKRHLLKDKDKAKRKTAREEAVDETTNIYRWRSSAEAYKKHIKDGKLDKAKDKALKDAAIGDDFNIDRVVWTYNQNDFEKLKRAKDINVVLQNEKFDNDTDLSTLFNFLPEVLSLRNQSNLRVIAELLADKAVSFGLIKDEKNAQKVSKMLVVAVYKALVANTIRYINIETEHKPEVYGGSVVVRRGESKVKKKDDTDDTLARVNFRFVRKVLKEAGVWCCDDTSVSEKDLEKISY